MKNDCRGDIVVEMLRLQMTAVNVVVTHAPAASYAAAAACEAGATASLAEGVKRSQCNRDVPVRAAIRFVPFAVESCGRLGPAALHFMGQLGSIAAGSGRISKGAFLRWAMQFEAGRDVPVPADPDQARVGVGVCGCD